MLEKVSLTKSYANGHRCTKIEVPPGNSISSDQGHFHMRHISHDRPSIRYRYKIAHKHR